jgi:gamma-glutamyltranspeptidase / glutathione hydrolase
MKNILFIFLFVFNCDLQARQSAAIASAHPLATQAGEDILKAGGNAFDAAVAVTAALAVVEPYSSGLGGGGFWLLHREQDNLDIMLDGREKAPLKAHRDMYLDEKGNVIKGLSINGALAAGIPGVPAAMVHLAEKYGQLPLAKSLHAAIQYAREGFAVDKHYQRMAGFRLKALQSSPAAADVFLAHLKKSEQDFLGKVKTLLEADSSAQVPEVGYIIKQPDLARTLSLIAKQGYDGFYKGVLAKKLVDGVQQAGGIWSLKDLSEYQIVEREPVHGDYHGMKITSAAPPSSGGIAIVEILNQLSVYPLEKFNKVQATHHIVEAMRRAYRDRAEYLGDSDFIKVPLEKLTNKNYAAGLSAGIHPEKATPSELLPGVMKSNPGQDTTHFSIMDHQGNRVAATLSINYPFGSGFVPPGTGVLLNDEMDDFSSKPGVPNVYGLVGEEANAIEPGKRMLSSMTPTFLETENRIAVIGTPGGSRIITMVLLGALEFHQGADADQIVNLPRLHHQYLPDVISYEANALTSQAVEQLQKNGHKLKLSGRTWGNMHIVIWDKEKQKIAAASDKRGVGKSIILP